MTTELLEPSDQVVLFFYILKNGIPDQKEVAMFARLMNWSEEEAQRAFDDAQSKGYIERY